MLNFMKTSRIPPLILLLAGMMGVSRHALNAETLQPIMSRSRTNRICVELCSGALGGAVCGDYCLDLIPDGLPVQYGQDGDENGDGSAHTVVFQSTTREKVCGVLCENNLGFPLCQCDIRGISKKRDRPDFLEVCAAYCNTYNYQLQGCQNCSLYKIHKKQHRRMLLADTEDDDDDDNPKLKYNWSNWCAEQCSDDNGGSACNCDRLPMMTLV